MLQRADRIKGVGFDKQHILSMTNNQPVPSKAKDKDGEASLNKIGAMNLDDLKYLDQQKKLTMISFLTEKIKAEKEERE